jgi:hypothetical protein
VSVSGPMPYTLIGTPRDLPTDRTAPPHGAPADPVNNVKPVPSRSRVDMRAPPRCTQAWGTPVPGSPCNSSPSTSCTASAALFAVAGQWPQTITAVCAVAILLAWIVLYARIGAPINPQLTQAAHGFARTSALYGSLEAMAIAERSSRSVRT